MPSISLIDHRPLTHWVSQFTFRAPFEHRAGQHVALQAVISGTLVRNYYSIASPPRSDRRIELCVRHDGRFGAYLRKLRPEDTVQCSMPAGTMRLLAPDRPAVYFAAGTGIAPVRAILLSQLAANPQADALLVLGARHSKELLYREQFDALSRKHAGFQFLPTVSRDDPGWKGRRGRVTDHCAEALGGRRDLVAYFCGQPDMVAALRSRLASAGIGDERQSFERY